MKLMYSGLFHSRYCSVTFLNVKIWSAHLRPFLKSVCSWVNLMSITASILPSRILQRTLDGMDSNVMPHQCWEFCRHPFLGRVVWWFYTQHLFFSTCSCPFCFANYYLNKGPFIIPYTLFELLVLGFMNFLRLLLEPKWLGVEDIGL